MVVRKIQDVRVKAGASRAVTRRFESMVVLADYICTAHTSTRCAGTKCFAGPNSKCSAGHRLVRASVEPACPPDCPGGEPPCAQAPCWYPFHCAMSSFSLLRVLADGQFHSGRELGRVLGLTRRALGSDLRRVAGPGVRILAARGHGYRLVEPLDLLDEDAVSARLRRNSPQLSLRVLDECASTNTLLSGHAQGAAPSGTVIACEHQSAGRGRRGNPWMSRIGGSLAFSVLWRFDRGMQALAGLSLAVAVAVAQALEREGVRGVQLKWPNDIVCRGRKLGGILIESASGQGSAIAVVIGVGINLRLDAGMRRRIDQAVTDVAACSERAPGRSDLLASLLESMSEALSRFSREGFAPFREEWLRRHAWQGRQVRLELAGRRIAHGEALGIAEDGALLLRSRRGIERFHSGEVSLRPS